jgi:hypothetical protein
MHLQCKRIIYGHPIIFYVNMGKDVLENNIVPSLWDMIQNMYTTFLHCQCYNKIIIYNM